MHDFLKPEKKTSSISPLYGFSFPFSSSSVFLLPSPSPPAPVLLSGYLHQYVNTYLCDHIPPGRTFGCQGQGTELSGVWPVAGRRGRARRTRKVTRWWDRWSYTSEKRHRAGTENSGGSRALEKFVTPGILFLSSEAGRKEGQERVLGGAKQRPRYWGRERWVDSSQ